MDVKVEPLLITLLLLHQDNTPKDQSKVKVKMKKVKVKVEPLLITLLHIHQDNTPSKRPITGQSQKVKVKMKIEPLLITFLLPTSR